MLTFSKKYCYKLIRFFQKNKINILNSLINRKIESSLEAENRVNKIEDIIKLFRQYDFEIKNINTLGVTEENLEQLVIAKDFVKNNIPVICNLITELPNILHKDYIKEDKVIFSSSDKELFNSKHKISFSQYVDSYNIRSSNGRVIFMDNDLLDIFNKLANFFILSNCKNNFHYIIGNEFIDEKYLYYAGQLPGLKSSLFKIEEGLFCIPTGEAIIIECISKNFKEIIQKVDKSDNGIYKICTYSRCFRNENSHHSKLNKPLIRQSIFNKVETFIICKLESEEYAFNLLIENAKRILDKLNMQYRIVEVGSYNMSKSAYKQYDIEIYFPITGQYIEVASCSSCNTYQLNRDADNLDKDVSDKYCTLNCSAFPIERILAAYIEYYWDDLEQKFLILPMLDSNQQPFG